MEEKPQLLPPHKQIPILRRIQVKCSQLITCSRNFQPDNTAHFSSHSQRKLHGLKLKIRPTRQQWLSLHHPTHTHSFPKHLYPHHLQQTHSEKESDEDDDDDDDIHPQPASQFHLPHRPFHLHFHIPHLHLPRPHLHVPSISVLKKQSTYSHPTMENPVSPPRKGYVVIYVGEERMRFEIPVLYLNHPLFEGLLKKAEEEFGFKQEGPLSIPCDVSDFEETQRRVKKERRVHGTIMKCRQRELRDGWKRQQACHSKCDLRERYMHS